MAEPFVIPGLTACRSHGETRDTALVWFVRPQVLHQNHIRLAESGWKRFTIERDRGALGDRHGSRYEGQLLVNVVTEAAREPEIEEEDDCIEDEIEFGRLLQYRRHRQLAVKVRSLVQPVPEPVFGLLRSEPRKRQRDDAARGPVARVADEQRVKQEDTNGPERFDQHRGIEPIEKHEAHSGCHHPSLKDKPVTSRRRGIRGYVWGGHKRWGNREGKRREGKRREEKGGQEKRREEKRRDETKRDEEHDKGSIATSYSDSFYEARACILTLARYNIRAHFRRVGTLPACKEEEGVAAEREGGAALRGVGEEHEDGAEVADVRPLQQAPHGEREAEDGYEEEGGQERLLPPPLFNGVRRARRPRHRRGAAPAHPARLPARTARMLPCLRDHGDLPVGSAFVTMAICPWGLPS
eukprot:gene15550-biopygen13521